MKIIKHFFPPRTGLIWTFFLGIGSFLSFAHEFTELLDWGENTKFIFFSWFFCLLFVLYVNGIIEHVLLNMQLDKLTNALNVSEKNRKGLIQQFRKSKKQIKYLKNSNAVLWAEIWQQAAHMSEKERSELSQRILLNTQIKEVVKNGRLQNRKNNR
ncbi:MAG: hypothetical protein ABF639_02620 [Lacticaseibacillus paracasei]